MPLVPAGAQTFRNGDRTIFCRRCFSESGERRPFGLLRERKRKGAESESSDGTEKRVVEQLPKFGSGGILRLACRRPRTEERVTESVGGNELRETVSETVDRGIRFGDGLINGSYGG